ncbi:DUF55-domain-containing protein, partial [Pyrenochaeta sp. DS3sAY3a]
MAGTRRSTRQSTTTAPKYTEASSPSADEKAPTRNGKKAASRKRAREEDDDEDEEAEDVNDDTPPPPKKTTKGKAKGKAKAPVKPAPAQDGSPKPTRAGPPPAPSSPSNRDASGSQEVFWLLKAEPLPRYENGINVAFSIDDLAACTAPEPWSGVRNPQARNNMQAMRVGDLGFFYHSNAKPSGVAGILRVVGEAVVDETAFDSKDAYFDAKSSRDAPKWYCVSVEFVKKFDKVVDLATIKGEAGVGGKLEGMQVVTNSRLSVSRVRKAEWEYILGLAGEGD